MKVNLPGTTGSKSAASARYTAPALEKGLELLEALATEPGGMTQKALAGRIGRSVTEIYRMLSVLEHRQYVVRDALTGQYALTLKLFELANRHPPTRRLLHTAMPVMRELAEQTGQSCHLVVVHGNRILVVAEEQSSLPMGFAVRLGASFPFSSRYVSARVLAAMQPEARREELARRMIEAQEGKTGELPPLLERLWRIAEKGHDEAPSETQRGITDISYPVRDSFGTAVAALSVPYLARLVGPEDRQSVVAALEVAASQISRAIGGTSAETIGRGSGRV